MLNELCHIRRRRAALRGDIDVVGGFQAWEETCVPSYCHSNWAAAWVSWTRLFRAAALARDFVPHPARVLDFGSSVGEIGHLLNSDGLGYDFIEEEQHAVDYLLSRLPKARQVTLEGTAERSYDVIFAIDSLEHNKNYPELLEALVGKLAPGGVLILSGPTENRLYRLGRRIAGFDGHYHETTIYAIEDAAAKLLRRRSVRTVVPMVPLFRITAWTAPAN